MPARPLLLGHRGARGEKKIPENTLASFDRALADGCDGFEFDVRLSVDGQAVVCHDAAARGLKIAASSSAQLALPLLKDILARYRKIAFLDIELKVPGAEEITLNLLRKSPPLRGFVVSSFLPEVLQTLHGLDGTIPLGLICETRTQLNTWPALPVEYVIPCSRLMRKGLADELKNAGKKIFVWTVNTAAGMKRFANCGVEGIISDHPGRLGPARPRGDQTSKTRKIR